MGRNRFCDFQQRLIAFGDGLARREGVSVHSR
jgi:hypothetical protein